MRINGLFSMRQGTGQDKTADRLRTARGEGELVCWKRLKVRHLCNEALVVEGGIDFFGETLDRLIVLGQRRSALARYCFPDPPIMRKSRSQ